MKANQVNQLKQLIQELVRREIKASLPQLIQEEVSKAMGKVLVEMVKEIKKPAANQTILKESVADVVEEEEQEETVSVPVFKTNNPKLTAALGETAKNFRGLPRDESVSMADMVGGFDKIGASEEIITEQSEPTTNLEFMKQMVGSSAPAPTKSVLDSAEVPDNLKKLFKKDFKAILALSKEKRS